MMSALTLMTVSQLMIGGLRSIPTVPGSEAYRLGSSVVTSLRATCVDNNDLECRDMSTLMMINITNAKSQLVNGENMWLNMDTNMGPMNVATHYSYYEKVFNVNTTLNNKQMPWMTINRTFLDTIAPPCVPCPNDCAVEYIMVVCANNITYVNPCVANTACRLDVTLGPCY